MSSIPLDRRRLVPALTARITLVLLLAVSCFQTSNVALASPAAKVVVGRRAIVVDERLSALRTRPEPAAPLVQRLRRGRIIGITGAVRGREGQRFYRVVLTQRTRGWILAEAVVIAGSETEAERLIQLIEEEKDGFAKVKLASVCVNEFRRTGSAARALMLLGESAERAAQQLTRLSERRLKADTTRRQLFMLNDVSLDRFSRLGIVFGFEEEGQRLVYDGSAYRELLRRYPRSPEAAKAREHGPSVEANKDKGRKGQ